MQGYIILVFPFGVFFLSSVYLFIYFTVCSLYYLFSCVKFQIAPFLPLRRSFLTSSPTVSLRINSCPNNCSGHGRCSPANSASGRVYCECDSYWKGEACNIPYCKNNCGSPDNGYCDLTGEKLCVCNDSWQGKSFISSWNLNSLGSFPFLDFSSRKLFFRKGHDQILIQFFVTT